MVYVGLMTDEPHMKKVEGHIPKDLWQRYEDWAEGRGKIQMRQLLKAMFRLFLDSPEWMQLTALYAKDERRIDREHKDPVKAVRAIVETIQPESVRLLSLEEQKMVDDIRRLLGPDVQAEKEPKRKGRRI